MCLSDCELELLAVLMRDHGRVVLRNELYKAVWGGPPRLRSRSVDSCVYKLRAKIDQLLPGWVVIHTHVGWGYRLEPQRRLLTAEATLPASEASVL